MEAVENLLGLIDEEACQRYIRALRWRGRPLQCPHCKSRQIAKWGRYHRKPGLLRYRCKGEGRTFNDLTGTLLDGSRLPSGAWILLGFLLTLGSSCLTIAAELGRSWTSAYRLSGRLRNLAIAGEAPRKLAGTSEGDEIYISAGNKGVKGNRPPRRRGLKKGRGRGHADKDRPCLIGWVSRAGQAVVHTVTDFTSATVKRVARMTLQPGSRVLTDSASSYQVLGSMGFDHQWVNHSQHEWVREDVHENRAENLWSLLKPYLQTFRGVSKRLLPGYVGFFQFLFNHRHLTAFQKAELLLWKALDPALKHQAQQGLFAPVKTKAQAVKTLLHAA